jgi:hypothetical protein
MLLMRALPVLGSMNCLPRAFYWRKIGVGHQQHKLHINLEGRAYPFLTIDVDWP